MDDVYQIGDVVLYWGNDYTDRWVGVVTKVHIDGAPIVKWQNAVSKTWRPPRVISPSSAMHILGRMPELVEWDID